MLRKLYQNTRNIKRTRGKYQREKNRNIRKVGTLGLSEVNTRGTIVEPCVNFRIINSRKG